MYTFMLSGQGTNILPNKPLLSPLTEGSFHAAAIAQATASRDLILGILLILLGLGIYIFWNIHRHTDQDSTPKRIPKTMTRGQRWESFWIKFP